MLAIQVFEPRHLVEMAVQPAQAEAQMPPYDRIRRGEQLASTGRAFTVRRRDDLALLMCGGALETHAGLATIWAVFAADAIADRRAMTDLRRRTRLWLSALPHRRIDTLVRSDHRAAHAYVHRLGFAAEARLNDYWPDGGDAVIYRYRRAS